MSLNQIARLLDRVRDRLDAVYVPAYRDKVLASLATELILEADEDDLPAPDGEEQA